MPEKKEYYNATAEVNQICDLINSGMYIEAIQTCDNTIAWYDLSPEDISTVMSLKEDASNRYNEYNSQTEKTREALLGKTWEVEGDKITSCTIDFYRNGTCVHISYRSTWEGTYTVSGNVVVVTLPADSGHSESWTRTFTYDGSRFYCHELGNYAHVYR